MCRKAPTGAMVLRMKLFPRIQSRLPVRARRKKVQLLFYCLNFHHFSLTNLICLVKDSNAEAKSEKMDEQTIPDRSVQEAPPASTPADGDDAELKGEEQSEDGAPVADESAELADATASTPASASKLKGRRKSNVPEHKKKLNKKQSKAKLTHTDAKPGDYFYVRLKGYPLWPAIVCDEDMLPSTLIKSRPVTAMRADGTYRSDYEDGGSKAKDRTFPVMYLFTNEL